MHMRVDEPRQQSRIPQINDLSPVRDFRIAAHRQDLRPRHHHHPAIHQLPDTESNNELP